MGHAKYTELMLNYLQNINFVILLIKPYKLQNLQKNEQT